MRVLSVGVLALAVLATACGGGAAPASAGGAAPASAGGRTIDVNMSEFAFTPATISLKAGETVTLRFKNTGTVEHEFMAGRQPMTGAGYMDDWLAMAKPSTAGGGMDHKGAGVRVKPKETVSLLLTVPAEKGEFQFGCFVPGHHEAGMKGTLVVQ